MTNLNLIPVAIPIPTEEPKEFAVLKLFLINFSATI